MRTSRTMLNILRSGRWIASNRPFAGGKPMLHTDAHGGPRLVQPWAGRLGLRGRHREGAAAQEATIREGPCRRQRGEPPAPREILRTPSPAKGPRRGGQRSPQWKQKVFSGRRKAEAAGGRHPIGWQSRRRTTAAERSPSAGPADHGRPARPRLGGASGRRLDRRGGCTPGRQASWARSGRPAGWRKRAPTDGSLPRPACRREPRGCHPPG